MPFNDMILLHFDANERQNAMDLLSQLRALLAPKLVQISPEDRQRFGSIGEENKKLVNKVKDLIEDDPSNVPTEVDWAEFAADYQDRRFLEGVRTVMNGLLSEIESTKIMHDYDNYQDALTYYNYQTYRMNSGAQNAEGKVEQMKQFFNRTGTTKKTEEWPSDDKPTD